MVQSSKTEPKIEDIEAQMKVIREDIAELSNLMKQAGEEKLSKLSASARVEAEKLVGESKKKIEEIEARVKQKTSSIEDYVSEKPVQSAFVALLIGLFIGSISRR